MVIKNLLPGDPERRLQRRNATGILPATHVVGAPRAHSFRVSRFPRPAVPAVGRSFYLSDDTIVYAEAQSFTVAFADIEESVVDGLRMS